MSKNLSFLQDNNLFEIEFIGHSCKIIILVIGNEKKYHKYMGQFRFELGNIDTLLGQFTTQEQFFKFMQQPANYIINFTESYLLLRWKIIAHSFKKRVQYKINLISQQLTEKESLQCEVIVLKQKLAQYQKAQQKRLRRNQKRRKSFKNTSQMNDSLNITNEKQDSQRQMDQKSHKKGKSLQLKRLLNNNRPPYTTKQKNININKNKKQVSLSQQQQVMESQQMQSQQHNKQNINNQKSQQCRINIDKTVNNKKRIMQDDYGISSNGQSPRFKQQSQIQNDSQEQLSNDPGQRKKNNYIQSLANRYKINKQKESDEHNQTNQLNKASQQKQKQIPKLQQNIQDNPKQQKQTKKQLFQQSKANEEKDTYKRQAYSYESQIGDQQNYKKIKSRQKIRIDFENGDYYYGGIKNNVFHGRGKYFSKINGTYDGQWRVGRANGYGITVDAQGNRHEGYYKNDLRHGKGKDWYPNGQKYQGQFVESNKDGFGTYYYINGDRYEGFWKMDKCQGHGKQIYANGTYYQGEWKQDQKNGPGILHTVNGPIKQTYNMGVLVNEEPIEQNQAIQ